MVLQEGRIDTDVGVSHVSGVLMCFAVLKDVIVSPPDDDNISPCEKRNSGFKGENMFSIFHRLLEFLESDCYSHREVYLFICLSVHSFIASGV